MHKTEKLNDEGMTFWFADPITVHHLQQEQNIDASFKWAAKI